jgi:ABC-type branched-subunit amino acid transport system substrate-binding protein
LGPSICRQGTCRSFAIEGCSTKSYGVVRDADDDLAVVGVLAPTPQAGPQTLFGDALVKAIALAEEGYRAANLRSSVAPPAIAVCDETVEPARAVKHFVDDLGARVVVGPVFDQNVSVVLNETRPRKVVLFSPMADDLSFASVPNDDGLQWSCRPNRERVARYYRQAFEHAVGVFKARRPDVFETTRAVVLNGSDPSTRSFLARVEPTLTINGAQVGAASNAGNYRQVVYTWSPTAATDVGALARDLASGTPPPNLVVIPSSLDAVGSIIDELELGWPAGAPRPSYLIDEPTDGLLSLVNQHDGLRGRLLGLRPFRDEASSRAFEAFVATYKQRYGSAPPARAEYAFDCFYLLMYSLASSAKLDGILLRPDVRGEAIRDGVAALSGPGTSIAVGSAEVSRFYSTVLGGSTVDLAGASGPLAFDVSKGAPDVDGEIYCVRSAGAVNEFCGTGVVFRASDGAQTSAPGGCTCE